MTYLSWQSERLRPIKCIQPWGLTLVLVLAGFLFLPWDVSIAKFCMADETPGELSNLIERAEFFGHAYGVLGIAITAYVLTPEKRRKIPRLLMCAISAGLAADSIKVFVHRVRPCRYDFTSGEPIFRGLSFLHAEGVNGFWDSAYHSLPSAHTATAVGVALALGQIFPKGRAWFATVATLTAASRVDCGAHFASDVCWGAAVGYLAAYACLNSRTRLSQWLDRWEAETYPSHVRKTEPVPSTRNAA